MGGPSNAENAAPFRLGWRARPWLRWLAAWCAVVLALVVWRWEQLTWPPYEDAACWLWMEADFLARSGFDYHALWTTEADPALVTGGTRAYMISVVPTLLAALMRLTPDPRWPLVAYHLLTFGCAAAIVLMVLAVVRRQTGSPRAGALAALAALTTPIFSVQVEALGIDLPMTALVLVSAALFWRERYALAALAGGGAFLIKPTGALAAMAALVYLALLTLARWRLGERAALVRGVRGALITALVLGGEVALVLGSRMMEVDQRWDPDQHNIDARLSSALDWSPDVALVLLLAAIATLAGGLLWLVRRTDPRRGTPPPHDLSTALAEGLIRWQVVLFSWTLIVGMLLAISRVIFLPRYLTLVIPLLYIVLGVVLFARPRRWPVALLIVLVAFNLANAEGRYFPDLAAVHGPEFARTNRTSPRASIVLERSHEYRHDLSSLRQAIARIEAEPPTRPVFTDPSFVVYLTHPRLGYVRQTRAHVHDLGDPAASLEAYLAYTDPQDDAPVIEGPLFLVGGHSGFVAAGPEPDDRGLYADLLPPPLMLYQKRWPAGAPSRRVRERWYLSAMVPGARAASGRHLEELALEVAARRTARGELPAAALGLEIALELRPGDVELLAALSQVYLLDRQTRRADEVVAQWLRRAPSDPRGWSLWGAVVERQHATDARSAALDAWLRSLIVQRGRGEDVEPADAYLRGMVALSGGQFDAARRALASVADDDPRYHAAQYLVGMAAGAVGEHDAAVRALSAALAGERRVAMRANLALGDLARKQDDLARAMEHYQAASAVEPAAAEPLFSIATAQRALSRREAAAERERAAAGEADAGDADVVGEAREAGAGEAGAGEAVAGEAGAGEAARGLLERAVAYAPDYTAAAIELGILLAEEGQWEAARASFRHALEGSWNDPLAAQNLAEAEKRLRRRAPRRE